MIEKKFGCAVNFSSPRGADTPSNATDAYKLLYILTDRVVTSVSIRLAQRIYKAPFQEFYLEQDCPDPFLKI